MDFIFNTKVTGTPHLDEILGHIRNVDWSQTCLGPMEAWPRDILQLCHIILLDPNPRCLLLDTERRIAFYNQTYAELCGDRHPEFLGASVKDLWKDLPPETMRPLSLVHETGRACTMDDFSFTINRKGVLQEVVLSWTVIPLAGVGGSYLSIEDVTEKRVSEMRRNLLRDFGKSWRAAPNVHTLWQDVLEKFSSEPQKFPFALLYSASERSASATSIDEWAVDGKHTLFQLEGSVGDFDDSASVPRKLDVATMHHEYPYIRDAMTAQQPILLTSDDEAFPEAWMHASENRGHMEPCKQAVVCPLRSNKSNKILGHLVLGINQRRPYDDSYKRFVDQIVRTLGDAITQVQITEEEYKRHIEIAERAYHATEKFEKMQGIVEKVAVGVFEYSHEGKLLQANVSTLVVGVGISSR